MSYYPPPGHQPPHSGPSYSQPLDPRLPPPGSQPPPHSSYSPAQAFLPPPPPFLPPPPSFDPYSSQPPPQNSAPPSGYNSGYGNDRSGPGQGYGPPPSQAQNSYGPSNGGGYGNERRDAPPSRIGNERGYGGPSNGNERDRGRASMGRQGGHDERRRSPDGRRDSGRLGHRDRGNDKPPRANKEAKCRTLFIRNVSYDAKVEWLRSSFAGFGEMKEFFDLVPKRGIIFITYYDLRAAERARVAMHNTEVEGRHIDVHYSLPKDADVGQPCGKDKNQGTILVSVRENGRLNENELGKMCEQFGEIKSVHGGRTPTNKVVEFWDSRGAVAFHEQMNGKFHQGGPLILRYLWDDAEPEPVLTAPPNVTIKDGREVRPVRPASPPRNNNRYNPPASDQGYASRGGAGGYDDRRGSFDRPADRRGPYDQGPPPDRYREAPPQAPPPANDRLDQARRVQDLLSSLGGSAAPPMPLQTTPSPYPSQGGGYAPTPTPRPPPPASNYGPPGGPPHGSNYAPPPASYGARPANDSNYGPNAATAPFDYGRPAPHLNPSPAQPYNPPGPPSSLAAPPQGYPPPAAAGSYGQYPPPPGNVSYGGPPPAAPAPDVLSLLAKLKK